MFKYFLFRVSDPNRTLHPAEKLFSSDVCEQHALYIKAILPPVTPDF